MANKIMFSAGEVSGDLHGSFLSKELKALRPDLLLFGMGSGRMRASGVDVLYDISDRASIGLLEALPNSLSIYSVFLRMRRLLKRERPDLLVLIDSQAFNVPLAKYARSLGIKTVYYIPPQEWLWGTPKNAKKIASTLDLIIAIFKEEFNVYKDLGARVEYFGHPLLDIVKPSSSKDAFFRTHSFSLKHPVLSLCPGSRVQEVESLFPILLESAKLLQKLRPNSQFAAPLSAAWLKPFIDKAFEGASFNCPIISGADYDALAYSDAVLAVSGTINLESCILGVPNLMFYRLSPLTYFIGKHILKIDKKMKYFSMPNILADEMVVPELVQDDPTPELLCKKALYLLDNRSKITGSFNKVVSRLGPMGSIQKSAQAILSFL